MQKVLVAITDKQIPFNRIMVAALAVEAAVRNVLAVAVAAYCPGLAALQAVAFHGVLVGRLVMPELVITQPLAFLVTSGPEAAVDGALLEEMG